MKRLSRKKKYDQMSHKYQNLTIKNVIEWFRSKYDLQRWRNKLVEISSSMTPRILLDMGGGNGQQILRLKSIYKKNFSAWIVDFAEKPKEITDYLKLKNLNYRKEDAFKFLMRKNIPKFDTVFMFGFLHEIKNINNLLTELKKKLKIKCNILISDNDLYRSADELSKILINIDINFTVYNSKSFFNLFHVFTKLIGEGKKKYIVFTMVELIKY
jgi:ubiquinone/menaquinone biosynthesis C-methylase UbiE